MGLHAEYVGHPFFDDVAESRLDEAFCRKAQADYRRIVGVLPGSRNHEVESNFPLQIDLMEQVAARHPDVHFLVACYKERHRERCQKMLASRPRSLPVELCLGRTPEIIEASDCCVMVSGSVSLEMLARAKPAVVLYRVSPLTYALVRPLVHVKSITLPNLIAGRRLMPEWMPVLRPDRTVREMAAVVNEWIGSPLPARPGRPRAATTPRGNRPAWRNGPHGRSHSRAIWLRSTAFGLPPESSGTLGPPPETSSGDRERRSGCVLSFGRRPVS